MGFLRDKLKQKLEEVTTGVGSLLHEDDTPSASANAQQAGDDEVPETSYPSQYGANRFGSFAPESSGDVKWYVDGASYFHAVSIALEQAQESIYILDWWLSPELYLRRPPAKNQQYRLDRMLRNAAERGVKVHIIVYKEVEQALTLDSRHTRKALEGLHENIQVFRHPDHIPRGRDVIADLRSKIQMGTFSLAKLPQETLTALYGTKDDVTLFWAHHEKLCVVDRKLAFMGGLDMCFGRWDTNSHAIADAHPSNLNDIIFPGQDYNNARVYDFEDVSNWENNKLDRTKHSRMGWSDISISLQGHIVDNLVDHFVDRWAFIWNEKYKEKDPGKYALISADAPSRDRGYGDNASYPESDNYETPFHFRQHARRFLGDTDDVDHDNRSRSGEHPRRSMKVQLVRSCSQWSAGHDTEASIAEAYIEIITNAKHFIYIENQFFITATSNAQKPVENKIGKAIVDRIIRAHREGEKFIIFVTMPAVPAFAGDLKSDGALGTRAIMEYQYFSINRGGNSIMECLQRAGIENPSDYIRFYNLRNYDRINTSEAMAQAAEDAGVSYEGARRDYDDKFGRAIDDERNQYESSRDPYERNRGDDGYGRGRYEGDRGYEGGRGGGYEGGYDGGRPESDEYDVQGGYGDRYDGGRDDDRYGGRQSGYGGGYHDEDYRQSSRYEDGYEGGYEGSQGGGRQYSQYERYQEAASKITDSTWDTISSCYMLNGPEVDSVPWNGSPESEIDAFVCEELYVHSKVLIADDRVVICGSANLNDRSQLGDHDSEIAVIIQDKNRVESSMNGEPYQASAFAASLRRYLFRKHLGLLPDQRWDAANNNWTPVNQHSVNEYDWGSDADRLVEDPLADDFLAMWYKTAKANTKIFRKVFHAVPDDTVRTWEDYEEFFSEKFVLPGTEAKEAEKGYEKGKVDYGHVVKDEFPGGVEEVKEWLGRVRGTLVEMPLNFLIDVKDLAKEGLSFNELTNTLYT